MVEISQVFTVEYLVPGNLDGLSPSPAFSVDQASENFKAADPDGVFRFSADEIQASSGGNLGLIDLTTPFDGDQNLFANRLVTWFYLNAPGAPGDGSAAVDSVNVRDDVPVRQILHASLAGSTNFFGTGFFVPQGSRLRVDGFTAGAEPILVRINVNLFETVAELLAALQDMDQVTNELAQFSAYLSVGVAIPGAALTPMPLDSIDFSFDTNVYSHVAGTSDVTVNEAGRYQVIAQASIDHGPGGGPDSSRAELFVDSGAGFMAVPGSRAFGLHRSTADGEATLPVTKLLTLAAGDVIRYAAVRIAGNDPLAYIADGCRFALIKLPEI